MRQLQLLSSPFRVTVALGLLALQPLASRAATTPHPDSFIKGMVVSCPRWGPIWGSDEMAESLSELGGLGVEWVAIHPYAWLQRDGSLDFEPAASLDFLTRAVELTEAAGIELFWKPHIGYWRTFRWRGDIQFGTDEAMWRRFFDDYLDFIVDQAAFAERAKVPLFAVGVELEQTTQREAEWRRIIAAVRRVYTGEIVYAANWDSLEKVPFWDAVDLIGVHAYFPLADGANPDRATLLRGWDRALQRVRQVARRSGNHQVIFAEIGYNRSSAAARTPWSYETEDSPIAVELQQRLIQVALERIPQEHDLIRGMFWWKWMPGVDRCGRNFCMRDPRTQETLRRYWSTSGPLVSD
jgi:hypothetical protein